MKKIRYISLLLLLSVLLSSCGGTTPADTDGTSSSDAIESTEGQEQTSEEKETDATENTTANGTEADTEDDTDNGGEGVTEPDERFTDISSLTSPKIEDDKASYLTAQSMPDGAGVSTVLRFDGAEATYSISALDIANIHNTADCPECGYREIDGVKAYYICQNPELQGGFTLTLNAPIPTELITGMTVTYMSSADITTSQVRILRHDASSNSAYINECPEMSGAVGNWKTLDLGLSASKTQGLGDGGAISAFKLYFRNKDGTALYIKDVSFTVSTESICKVSYITENCFYKGQAVEIVAQEIASRFSSLGIDAEITVKSSGYSANSPKKTGKLTYNVIINYADGREESFKALTANILPVSNIWLELGDSPYAMERDSKGQYASFDKGGVISLEDNVMRGADGLKTLQYAIISPEQSVTDEEILWRAPEKLDVDGDSFSLFINAFLDYGKELIEGEDYRFVIRGVTEHNCYALHLDIPFTYSPHAPDAEQSLLGAAKKLEGGAKVTLEGANDIEKKVKSEIESLINDGKIEVSATARTVGIISALVEVSLTFPTDEKYAYSGDAFTFDIPVTYGKQGDIVLLAPADGARDLQIASSYVIEHMAADMNYLTSAYYPFVREERCAPPAITLKWQGKGDKYSVKISESPDMSGAISYTADGESLDLYNLKANTTYYWQVSAGGESSAILCFTTADQPRFIKTEGVSNFRDIGGWVTLDGKRIKQGLAYRSAQLEAVSKEDIDIITKKLGVKTDLDLRGQSSVSPLGYTVNVLPISIKWYNGIFPEEHNEAVRQAICEFANESNYPMVYHCAIGRDRTGTVTILILGLLGVDEETIIRDYLLSFQAVSGNDGTNSKAMVAQANSFISGLASYAPEGATLKEQVEGFLSHIGVTAEQMQKIRDILLEE